MAGNWGRCLKRRGGTFWFRRRVPASLTDRLKLTEITRSLRTSCARDAGRSARKLWLKTEELFDAVARRPTLSEDQLSLLLRRLIDEPLTESPTADSIYTAFCENDLSLTSLLRQEEHLVAAVKALPPEEQEHLALHLERLTDRLEIHVARTGQFSAQLRTALVAEQLADLSANGVPKPPQLQLMPMATLANANLQDNSDHQIHAPISQTLVSNTLVSALYPAFLKSKQTSFDGHQGYDEHTVDQTEVTFRLWLEFVGDFPIQQITGQDAANFREQMLRLPSSHGKGEGRIPKEKRRSAKQSIALADAQQATIDRKNAKLPLGVPRTRAIKRITMKTLKRHFSALSQFWIWAAKRQLVPRGDADNPFRGWDYPGVTRKKKSQKRLPWTGQPLVTLLTSSWFSRENRGTTYWWITVIAMFTGMRIEEICRLRSVEDIDVIDGIPCFLVQEQAEGSPWSPKSDAGERCIPIHDKLLDLGIMNLVADRRTNGHYRLFPDLIEQGNKLSAVVSRKFSLHKTKLGIGEQFVFHSWRHNVETALHTAPAATVRTSWIDAILGHEAGEGEDADGRRIPASEGARTYLHRIGVQNLQTTVNNIVYPEVDLSVLRS